ncbi:pentapeptide repeat-containing protein [Methylomonas koyamae]|uniref:pentapeptide repeat-containing protein n=1 Tax=Methylomonas koyamae TaxID=702114 RepID=UPI0006D0AD18|nr:pentapeptide repeat-containing protein [Methylomonas koyamae]
MKGQDIQKNYLPEPDEFQLLTQRFRSGLEEWRDEKNEPKLVSFGGEYKPLLKASINEVIEYAKEFTEKWQSIPEEQKNNFKSQWFIDCRGLFISLSPADLIADQSEFSRDWAPVNFDYSEIHDNYLLFAHNIFLGNASFYDVKFCLDIRFDETKFYGEVNFDSALFYREAFFVNCEFGFNKGASFQRATFSRRADFSRAVFNRAPILHEAKLAQGSSFTGARFEEMGHDKFQRDFQQEIIALRTLRQLAAIYKGQQDEANFFALEQRYYRKVFLAPRLEWQNESYRTSKQGKLGFNDLLVFDTWHPGRLRYWKYCFVRWTPIEWFISLGYDWISEYGSNVNRAVYWLLGINIMSFLMFIGAECLGFSEFKIDLHKVNFCALQNVHP